MKALNTTGETEKTQKVMTYRAIDYIEVSGDDIYDVVFADRDDVIEWDKLMYRKEDVLNDAQMMNVSGYGRWSGKSLWQLPEKMQRKVRSLMHRYETLLLLDGEEWEGYSQPNPYACMS